MSRRPSSTERGPVHFGPSPSSGPSDPEDRTAQLMAGVDRRAQINGSTKKKRGLVYIPRPTHASTMAHSWRVKVV